MRNPTRTDSGTPLGGGARSYPLATLVFLPVVLFVVLSLFSSHAASPAAAVWVADQKQLKRVDPAVNQYVQAITLQNAAEAIAFDAKNNVLWALANKHLLKFTSSGALIADFDLSPPSQPTEALKRLVLDPYDASLWVAGEKTVLHVSAQGQILLKWTSSQNLQAIALDPDQSLWVLTQNGLTQLSVAGTVLSNLAIPNTLIPDPTFLAVDGLGGYLWVAGKKQLVRLDANDLTKPPLAAPVPASVNGTNNKLEALLTHPLFGTVWAVSSDTLLLFDRDATLIRQVVLGPYALGNLQAIAYEQGSASLWLGGKVALGRFTPNGDFVTKLPADIAISAIATGPFSVSPTLTLLAPIDNSVTNNPRPPFRLGLGAECNGAPCDLVDAYTQSFTFDATLNGSAIGSLFSLANREALYIPPTRLPEGLNLFSAQAKDVFGHLSNRINGQVTIDTIPPKFLSIAPADGSTLTIATVTVSGKLDDPTASVMLQNAAGTVLNVGGATFSFAVTLAQGLNTFTLTAQDPAGNATRISYGLTFNQPILINVTKPSDGAVLTGTSTTVAGVLSAPPGTTVRVNGIVASVNADGSFSVAVPLSPGSNTLSVVATAPDGRTVTRTLTVTVETVGGGGGPTIIHISASPIDRVRAAMNAAGQAVVVWRQRDGNPFYLYASRFRPGLGWGAPRRIGLFSDSFARPDVAIDAAGNAIAVWTGGGVSSTSFHAYDFTWADIAAAVAGNAATPESGQDVFPYFHTPVIYDVYANRCPADQEWDATQTRSIENSPGSAFSPIIALSPDGQGIALWNQAIGGVARVYANRFEPGRGWGTPEPIESEGSSTVYDVASDAQGNALAVWARNDGTVSNIYSNRYQPGQGWGPTQPVEAAAGSVQRPAVAMDAQGNAIAVWRQSDGTSNSIYANRYVNGGGWGNAVLLGPTTASVTDSPFISMDADGRALAAWLQRAGAFYDVFTSRFDPGLGWFPPERVAGGLTFATIRGATYANGQGAVLWNQFDLKASRYTQAGGWAPPEAVEDTNEFVGDADLAGSPLGNFLVAWGQSDQQYRIYARFFSAQTPGGSAPRVTPPPDITIEATAVLTPVALGTATAIDATDGALPALPDKTGPFGLGANVVTWRATNSAGRTGSATQIVSVRDTTPPSLVVPNGITLTVTDPAQLPVQINLGTATATDIFNPVTITNNAPPRFQPGTTIVTWTATDANKNKSVGTQPVTVVFTGAVYVDITSPVSGSVIRQDTVSLVGTFQGPPNTGVSANGVIGFVDGDKVYINNVPLKPGINTIVVTATTPDGVTFTRTITVTSNYPPPLRVSAHPESGIAPFTTQFFLSMTNDEVILGLTVDFLGDGKIYTSIKSLNSIFYTYANPGIYPARFTVSTVAGNNYEVTHTIGVRSLSAMDGLFATIWTGMNNALARGDVTAALGYLNEAAKRKYLPVFSALLPQMPQIIASYSPLRRVSIGETIGEYAVNRSYNGQNRLYLVYFLKDQDGVWRLDAM